MTYFPTRSFCWLHLMFLVPNICLQLSAVNNHVVRMHQVSQLSGLTVLSLANNSIVSVEGVEHLQHLTWLDLSNNSIKVSEWENLSNNSIKVNGWGNLKP